jgi:t-SNARE complex subunit (syntaxin)
MIVVDDVGIKHEGDNVQTAGERKKQIKEDRKRNSLSARIMKYFSYAICLIIVVFIVRRLLKKMNIENGCVEPSSEKTK